MPTRPEDADLVDALAQTAFVVTGVLSRIAAQHDLSLTLMRVLGILRDRSPRMAELAAYLGLEKSTTSGLVERGERRGLVRRAASPADGRAVHVSLTPAGARLARRSYQQVREALQPLIQSLDEDQQDAVAGLLATMVSARSA